MRAAGHSPATPSSRLGQVIGGGVHGGQWVRRGMPPGEVCTGEPPPAVHEECAQLAVEPVELRADEGEVLALPIPMHLVGVDEPTDVAAVAIDVGGELEQGAAATP